jgi:hypothetical protein
MTYSFQTMWQYRYEQEHEEKPCWCVTAIYEYDEPEYKNFPNGVEQLTGEGFEYLTKQQAEDKSNELDAQFNSQ